MSRSKQPSVRRIPSTKRTSHHPFGSTESLLMIAHAAKSRANRIGSQRYRAMIEHQRKTSSAHHS